MTGSTKSRKPEHKKKAIQLIRVSTLAQAGEDRYGISSQQEACRQVAEKQGLEVPDEWKFEIKDVSGANVRRSPKVKQLLELVKTGLAAGIIMSEQSRLMRDTDSEVLRMLQENNCKLFLPDGPIDLSDPSQALFGEIKFSFAKYERIVIRTRMLNGKLSKRREGKWPSGKNSVPYGLELDASDRLQLGKEISRVEELFKAFIEGGGFLSFKKLADMTGVPMTRIGYILANEIYTGYHVPKKIVCSKQTTSKGKKATEIREDGSIRYQRREIIPIEERESFKMLENAPISQSDFAKAQKLLELRREMHLKSRLRDSPEQDPFSYRGFLRCAECQKRIITLSYTNKQKNNFRAEYYVCQGAHGARRANQTWRIKPGSCPTRRMRREALDEYLDSKVAQQIGDPRFIAKIIEAQVKAEAHASDTEERMKRIRETIQATEEAIERLSWLFERGSIKKEAFVNREMTLQAELNASRAALAKLRPSLGWLTPEMWAPIADRFRNWRKYDQGSRRALLAATATIFEVAGYQGVRYHETLIKAKHVRLNLSGNRDEAAGEIVEDLEEGGAPKLVAKKSRLYSALVNNQPAICLPL